MSKAAQSAPCITTRATQKGCRVVVQKEVTLFWGLWSSHLLTWCMLQRCDAGVCIRNATKRLPRLLHPLTVICYCYLLFHVGTSDTARSSLEYEGLQSTGRSGKGLWSAGNFSLVLLFKGKGSERASWVWQIRWLVTGLVPQPTVWLLQSMALSLRNLISWGWWGPSVREGEEHLPPWALNRGTSIHPTPMGVVPVPARDAQSLQRDHTAAGEHLKSSTRNSRHSSQLHWGDDGQRQLKYLCADGHSMGNNQEQLEPCTSLQGHRLTGIVQIWCDGSYDHSVIF